MSTETEVTRRLKLRVFEWTGNQPMDEFSLPLYISNYVITRRWAEEAPYMMWGSRTVREENERDREKLIAVCNSLADKFGYPHVKA